jgi:cytochrome P450
MEQATIPRPAAAPASASPPGSRMPAIAQAGLYMRDPLRFLVRLHRRYGDVFSVSFPFYPRVVYVANPALVKELFTASPKQLHAGEANATVLGPSMGSNSVLTLDEDTHMRHRKLLLPPFHGKQLQRYSELAREFTLQEMERWPVGQPFALLPHMQRITLAVIMRALFGTHDEERLARFERLNEKFAWRVSTLTAAEPLRRDFGSWSPWGRFLRVREELDAFIYEQISLRRATAADQPPGDDVLALLLAARHDDGSPLSDVELRDELVTILGAGHETSATGLAWAMERLLRNPRVLERLRESIAAGEDEYLDATIKEGLRVRPVIVDVARRLIEPMEIAGYQIPADTFVMGAIAALHYREDLFPEPDEFRPERFLDGKAETYSWIPFGGGIRRCIGAAFAEYEMRIILRAILERADLRAPDRKPEGVKVHNLTMDPAKGAQVILDQPLS